MEAAARTGTRDRDDDAHDIVGLSQMGPGHGGAQSHQRFLAIWALDVDKRPAPLAAMGQELGFNFSADDVAASFEALGLGDDLTEHELELISGGATASDVTKPLCFGATTCMTCCASGISKCTSCTCPKLC